MEGDGLEEMISELQRNHDIAQIEAVLEGVDDV